jgi:hypothetical protein
LWASLETCLDWWEEKKTLKKLWGEEGRKVRSWWRNEIVKDKLCTSKAPSPALPFFCLSLCPGERQLCTCFQDGEGQRGTKLQFLLLFSFSVLDKRVNLGVGFQRWRERKPLPFPIWVCVFLLALEVKQVILLFLFLKQALLLWQHVYL